MQYVQKRQEGYDPFVRSLIRFSTQVVEQPGYRRQRRKISRTPAPAIHGDWSPSLLGYSSPLSALRERDVHALVDIFADEHLPEVEADIHQYLGRLYPEPCWEVEPYEFLKDLLSCVSP